MARFSVAMKKGNWEAIGLGNGFYGSTSMGVSRAAWYNFAHPFGEDILFRHGAQHRAEGTIAHSLGGH